MFRKLFNRTKTAPQWKDLTPNQRATVTKKIVKAFQGGARYKLVSGSDEMQRERGAVEYKGEDEILNAYGRGKMLDLARNATRNSSTFAGILKQFDLNAIGTNGGKAIFDFDGSERMKELFSSWTREADFFDGLTWNTMLKLILKTYILGGDMVLLFDDGLVEDSGKILLYEPDEIGNTTPDALARHFGKSARQSLGRVYNGNGRWIGSIVSRSQRGCDVFDPSASYFLHRDPDASMFDSFWLMPRNVFRIAQGRGVSPLAPSLGSILDGESLCEYELAAAKLNARMLAQVIQSDSPSDENELPPSAFDAGTDFDSMTDEEIEQAAKAEAQSGVQTQSLDVIRQAGAIYQVMPENTRLEVLRSERPSNSVPQFLDWLACRSVGPFGLSQTYGTFQPSGADFRANQLFSARAFEEAQKFLEQICDWTLYRWALWERKRGNLDFDDDFIRHVKWSWPRMDEIDETAHQNAVQMKLQNMTGSYAEEYGPDWKEKLLAVRDEVDFFKRNNLPHPCFTMKSGGERTGADATSDGNKSI